MITNLLSACLVMTNTWVQSTMLNETQRVETIHVQAVYYLPIATNELSQVTRHMELKSGWQEVNPPRRVTSMSPPPLPVPQGSSSMTNVPLPGTFWIATNTPFGIGTNRYELPPGAYNVLNSPPPLPTNNPPFTATIKR